MAVKFHRCPSTWLKTSLDPCWRVQKALNERGIDYEVVKHPHRKGKRPEIDAMSGQRLLPVLELEDGRVVREESKEMAAKIRAGELP